MEKKKGVLIVGIVLIVASIAIYAVSVSTIKLQSVEIPGNSQKNITYELKAGNYTLMLNTAREIHYTLSNETQVIAEGNVSSHLAKRIGYLNGTYVLSIKNLDSNATVVAYSLKSENSLTSIGIQVLSSGGVCLVGVILAGVGAWLLMQRGKENVH